MDRISNAFVDIYRWAREDYFTWPTRFVLEVLVWVTSIGNSIVFAVTVPNPPFHILYPIWIAGCITYAWAAWTRRSFGMLSNYVLLASIDSIGYLRLLLG
jgi:hypothetical protein